MEVVLPKVVVVVEVVVLVGVVVQIPPGEPSNILVFFAVEVPHLPQRVCVKDEALENMPTMLVTLDTSQSERSRLNADAL